LGGVDVHIGQVHVALLDVHVGSIDVSAEARVDVETGGRTARSRVRYVREGSREIALNVTQVLD
jgi:hypothetical protein